jgi:hypothetical protein
MAIALTPLFLILYVSNVACWTYTEYLTVVTTSTIEDFGFGSTIPTTVIFTVSPTGPVSPTKTEITTVEATLVEQAVLNITVTDLYLAPGASVCSNDQFTCSASTTAATLNTIDTSVWAAVTISNPSTCTQTSFIYTTSSVVVLSDLYVGYQTFQTVLNEATDTGPNGEALFVTTFVSTVSVDLGGQPITQTFCDIWLKNGALQSLALNENEVNYLAECVDPRRYLCNGDSGSSATCGTDWIGTYPMTAGAVTGGRAASTTGRGGGTATSSTTKASGVAGGKRPLYRSLILTTFTVVASLCILSY